MKKENKYILISGAIPLAILLFWFASELIMEGLSEKSDITVLLSVLTIGLIIVVIGFIIKYLTKNT